MFSGAIVLNSHRDNEIHSREKGIIRITFTDVGRPAHCGWHHSLCWDPGLCKWEKG